VIRMAVVMSAVNVDDDVQLAIRNGDYRTSTGNGSREVAITNTSTHLCAVVLKTTFRILELSGVGW
jgi:hypothetical protein